MGVTGGIGSGKSLVCREFARLGRKVLSADVIARELTERDPYVQREIRKAFGSEFFTSTGSLRRKELAGEVFRDQTKRKRLNGIVHPGVFKQIESSLGNLSRRESQLYVVIEAALIFETGMDQWLNYTIVVNAREETRIARVMHRDRCSRSEMRNRIASQMPAGEKVARADFVIQNDGGKRELRQRVIFLDRVLSALDSG